MVTNVMWNRLAGMKRSIWLAKVIAWRSKPCPCGLRRKHSRSERQILYPSLLCCTVL